MNLVGPRASRQSNIGPYRTSVEIWPKHHAEVETCTPTADAHSKGQDSGAQGSGGLVTFQLATCGL